MDVFFNMNSIEIPPDGKKYIFCNSSNQRWVDSATIITQVVNDDEDGYDDEQSNINQRKQILIFL